MPKNRARQLVGLLLVFAGCNNAPPPAQQYSHLPALNVAEVLDARFASQERLHFHAWDGRHVGSDCDAEVVLFSNGVAKYIRYGNTIVRSVGTYTIDGTSILFEGNELQDWPPLVIKRDGEDLLLVPTESTDVIDFGGKAWPLRIHAGFDWAEYDYRTDSESPNAERSR